MSARGRYRFFLVMLVAFAVLAVLMIQQWATTGHLSPAFWGCPLFVLICLAQLSRARRENRTEAPRQVDQG